ncbi:hypothetical protein Tsubulata_018329 [Turnera subulata]|uniref:Uncharacterized protein n=1 Tax=Turnera subulata TaxID=218843 RepID=A0A9Q0JHL1_9ROSI|nr:hypothetical protein Tsubulata_018329 [Turnera subulata]
MESAKSKIRVVTLPNQPSKRLLFDRRYGWVFDEWKDPSVEALAGGRGMFCVLPLAKVVFNSASVMINHAASFAARVYENPELVSPLALRSSIDDQVKRFNSSLEKLEFGHFAAGRNSPSHTATFPHQKLRTGHSQMA